MENRIDRLRRVARTLEMLEKKEKERLAAVNSQLDDLRNECASIVLDIGPEGPLYGILINAAVVRMRSLRMRERRLEGERASAEHKVSEYSARRRVAKRVLERLLSEHQAAVARKELETSMSAEAVRRSARSG